MFMTHKPSSASNQDVPSGSHAVILTSSGRLLQLYQEDCLKGIAGRLEAESVSVIMTSPPYNLGIAYRTYDDTIPREEFLRWIEDWAIGVKKVLHPDGSIFLNLGSRPADPWVPFEVLNRLRPHFVLQNVIHWVKSIYIEHRSYGRRVEVNVGHYKPINSPRFLNDNHEYIFHLTHHGRVHLDRLAIGVPYKDESNVERWRGARKGLRCRGNCWYIPYETISRRERDRPHPATFPPLLAEMCIRLHGVSRISLVLDPFMGLGSTALACIALDLPFTGFEIDPCYFQEALRRIRGAARQGSFPWARGGQ